MASADWTLLPDSLSIGTVDRGATAGIARPNGGGNFVFGFASTATNPGGVALFTNQANFAPCTKGASITGCLQRGIGGGLTGFSPFLYLCLGGLSMGDTAYMLGLSDEDPHRIKLVKGPLNVGIPAQAVTSPPAQGVLAASSETYSVATWLQVRLDAIVNGNGDVVLNCYENDLTANPCTSPVWTAIDGIPQIIDDLLGVNTGSAPLTSGYAGFGFATANVTRRSFFDQITITRQL